jgi:hypothetical protein
MCGAHKASMNTDVSGGVLRLSPRGMDGPIRQDAKIQIRKIKILKIANRKKEKLKNFYRNFFHEIDHEIVCRKIALLFPRSVA